MLVRVTGVVVEDGCLLVLDQDTYADRTVSLPGGTVEVGDTLEAALVREMREETGADVVVGRLLYVCDHIAETAHVLHVTFEATVVGGVVGDVANGVDSRPLRGPEGRDRLVATHRRGPMHVRRRRQPAEQRRNATVRSNARASASQSKVG